MSRTYEALRKLERTRASGRARAAGDAPPARRPAGTFDRDCELQYERLRVWMANQGDNGSSVRIVMVTACRRECGTTTTVAGLAAALSDQPAARVLMVDANLRAPALEGLHGVGAAAGVEGELSIQPTGRPNLFLLAATTLSKHPVATFDSGAIARLVADVKGRFDFVIVDTPPLLEFPEGYSVARHVDAVLLVVDAERTSLEDARRTTRDLERAGARRAAIVLNRQRDYMPRLLRRFLGVSS